MFEEKKVDSGSYEQCKLEELTPAKGDSVGFYLTETPMIDGDDGQFMVCNGLLVDLSSETVEDLISSAKAVSFIPKSILEGDITDGQWNIGQLARLENTNRPGDLNKKGKKTRYYAWDVFIQNAPNDVLAKLKAKNAELQGESPATMGETPAKSDKKPKL